jgi:hypothetical protein
VKRILADTDWEVFGMDLSNDKLEHSLDNRRLHFIEGDISISKEWIEYHVKKCDVVLPLVAHRDARAVRAAPIEVFELDFEENLQVVRQCVRYRKRLIFPVDLRGLRHVRGRGVRRGGERARPRSDPHAALDLLVREAAAGSRDRGATATRRARLHALPPVQLDRPRLDRIHSPKEAARASSRSSSSTCSARNRSASWTAARSGAASRTSTTASTA